MKFELGVLDYYDDRTIGIPEIRMRTRWIALVSFECMSMVTIIRSNDAIRYAPRYLAFLDCTDVMTTTTQSR